MSYSEFIEAVLDTFTVFDPTSPGFARTIERGMAAVLSAEMVSVSQWRVVPFEAVDEAVGERRDLKPEEHSRSDTS